MRMIKTVLSVVALVNGGLFAQTSAPKFDDFVQNKMKDLRMTVRSEAVRLGELRKINTDFANAYRFRQMEAYYEEPGKIRLESEVMNRKVTYVINNDKKLVIAPNQRVTEDVSNSPGKRQSMMDFGVITPFTASRMNKKYLRQEQRDGKTLFVFELTWNYGDDDARHIVWMDPKTKLTVRREWFDRWGRHMANFEYKDPVEVAPGVWMPSKVEVFNGGNRFGGRTVQQNIRVNQGLKDTLFKI